MKYAYAGVKVGPFFERGNKFELPDFEEEKLFDLGFDVDEYGNYVYRENDMLIIVCVTDKMYGWGIGYTGMDELVEWLEDAIKQYRNTKGKRGPSSWVDYVG